MEFPLVDGPDSRPLEGVLTVLAVGLLLLHVGQAQSTFTQATTLNPEYFLNSRNTVDGSDGQRSLFSRVIRVAVEEWQPHVAVHEAADGAITISGPMAKLLTSLADAYNFRYQLIRSTDGMWGEPHENKNGTWGEPHENKNSTWGEPHENKNGTWGEPHENENGTWVGMIGMVMRKEVDIALGPFGLTASRASVVKFSNPVIIDYYRILLKRNLPVPDPWSFLKPFAPLVWLAIFVSYIVVTVAMAYSLIRTSSPSSRPGQGDEVGHSAITPIVESPSRRNVVDSEGGSGREDGVITTSLNSIGRTFWNLYSLFLQQSIIWNVRDGAVLFVLGIWLMAALVLMRVYSSGLTSLLAVRSVPIEINGLEDLIYKSDLEMILEASTALTEYLTKAKTGIFGAMASEAGRTQHLKTSVLFEAADDVVMEGRGALLVEETSCMVIYSDSFTKRGVCDFILARDPFWPLVFCIIGQLDSLLIDVLNTKIRSLVEHDLYNRWIKEQVSNFSSCFKAPTQFTITEPHNLIAIWGMFFLFACGMVVACVSFALEVFCCRNQRSRPTAQRYHEPEE